MPFDDQLRVQDLLPPIVSNLGNFAVILNASVNQHIETRQAYYRSDAFQSGIHNQCLLATKLTKDLSTDESIRQFLNGAGISQASYQLHDLERQIYHLQLQHAIAISRGDRTALETSDPPSGEYAAFIFFQTIDEAQVAHDVLSTYIRSKRYSAAMSPTQLQHPAHTLSIGLCPSFNHIIWDNFGSHQNIPRTSRRRFAYAFFAGIIFIWVVFQLPRDSAVADFFSAWQSGPLLLVRLAILSPAFVSLVNFLLPIVLGYLAKSQGVVTIQRLEITVLFRYFMFQVVGLFVVSIIGLGTLINVLIAHVSIDGMLRIMADQIAQSGYGASNWLCFGLIFFAIEVALGRQSIKLRLRRFISGVVTPRMLYRFSHPKQHKFEFVTFAGYLTLASLVGLSYSIVTPYITLIWFIVIV
eukprot:jgi/Hompol1/4583/HPOL_001905-RA